MHTKIIIIMIGLIMIVLGYWYGHIADNENDKLPPSIDNGIMVGQVLMPFTLTKNDGSSVMVRPAGKIIVINFWDTWSPLNSEEMLKLETLTQKNWQKVSFYTIYLQESHGKKSDESYENTSAMTILTDKDGIVYGSFQINSTPTTIIVNKHGIIKYRKFGSMTGDELEGIINSL